MMKKIATYTTAILLLMGTGGCDFLDYDESSYLLEEQVFSDFDRTESFLTGIYAFLPADFSPVDGAMRSSASDDALHVWDQSNVRKFYNGSWSAVTPLDNVWGRMYAAIRASNKFLEEIEGETFEDLLWNEEYWKVKGKLELFPYEARFLRAYFYFELVKRYGSVPLITTVLTPEEANGVSQVSFDEVVQFIANECDSVWKYLPPTHQNLLEGETGRITKGAALALKSRVLLYAASPLHNESADPQKWIDAADAAIVLIDSVLYELEGNYDDVVNNPTSVELILGTRQGESNSFEKKNFPMGYEGGNTGTCPTQNLVDAYEMATTGLPIDDPGSDYDSNFPYQDRDPRMESTVLRNGDMFKGQTIETWYGGTHAQPGANATRTGYYLRKYVIESINLSPTNTTRKRHTWVLFRYAEVLLNYAEAMNEVYGPDDAAGRSMTALDAVNLVRARAEMAGFPAGMSQAGFRERLRNERRVELAFEDHRFWDIRRWQTGESTKEILGILITENPFGGYAYEQVVVEERVFEEKMNLYPVPQTEIYINNNLQQNPGW
ncbi:MAG: RagB/SusD family nutrient uptake outer membrane protein [Bacteroidota bacterium]